MNLMNNLKNLFLAILFLGIATSAAFAQTEGEITDEDLKKYAMVMDSIDVMKQNIQDELNEMIQSEEAMQGGRRYLEIQKAAGDPAQLEELEVTEEEQMVYDNIQAKYDEMTGKFKDTYTNLIKDELGGTLYNDITKALREDEEVKQRYETISAELKESKEGVESGSEVEG